MRRLSTIVLRTSRFFPEADDEVANQGRLRIGNVQAMKCSTGARYRGRRRRAPPGGRESARDRFSPAIRVRHDPLHARRSRRRCAHAPEVVQRLFPECEAPLCARGWRLFRNSTRLRQSPRHGELGWRPKYDFRHVLECLRAETGFFAVRWRARVGSKGITPGYSSWALPRRVARDRQTVTGCRVARRSGSDQSERREDDERRIAPGGAERRRCCRPTPRRSRKAGRQTRMRRCSASSSWPSLRRDAAVFLRDLPTRMAPFCSLTAAASRAFRSRVFWLWDGEFCGAIDLALSCPGSEGLAAGMSSGTSATPSCMEAPARLLQRARSPLILPNPRVPSARPCPGDLRRRTTSRRARSSWRMAASRRARRHEGAPGQASLNGWRTGQ